MEMPAAGKTLPNKRRKIVYDRMMLHLRRRDVGKMGITWKRKMSAS